MMVGLVAARERVVCTSDGGKLVGGARVTGDSSDWTLSKRLKVMLDCC